MLLLRDFHYLMPLPPATDSKNDHYKSFRTSIWEINHTTPCPPMSDFLSLKRPDGGEDVDEDEDIEIGGQTMEYKCPITLMPFVNAVKR